ncbi:MAG: hypothetical protein E7408_04030 [Ruminococcaceae bacterium]|nr:hypothetical protein [Oscillospiraceae bacterium]
MIDIFESTDSGFSTKILCEGWKAAFITYSAQYDVLTEMKRHLKTDEAFVLLRGDATIYTYDGVLTKTPMEPCKLYNIRQSTWHHVSVSPDALLFVVENSDTTKENTERIDFDALSKGN